LKRKSSFNQKTEREFGQIYSMDNGAMEIQIFRGALKSLTHSSPFWRMPESSDSDAFFGHWIPASADEMVSSHSTHRRRNAP